MKGFGFSKLVLPLTNTDNLGLLASTLLSLHFQNKCSPPWLPLGTVLSFLYIRKWAYLYMVLETFRCYAQVTRMQRTLVMGYPNLDRELTRPGKKWGHFLICEQNSYSVFFIMLSRQAFRLLRIFFLCYSYTRLLHFSCDRCVPENW